MREEIEVSARSKGRIALANGYAAHGEPARLVRGRGGRPTEFWLGGGKPAQAAIQFDRPLGSGTSPAQLSIGAYYQYQRYPGIFKVPTGATTVPNTSIPLAPSGATVLSNAKGSLYVLQAIVTVHIPAAGVNVPIGISYSNRTDLAVGNEVRAHIGFTFNSEGPLLSVK